MHSLARRLAAPVALGVLATAYAWWRVPAASRNRLWAEDGREFLAGSLAGRPPWASYDGYLHVVPRLLADAITAVVPVGRYDLAATAVSVGVLGLVCALTYVLAGDVLDARWVRALVALAPVLLPAAGVEVIGNLANLHAFGLWLALWLFLHRPSSRAAAVGWAIAGVLVGLSEIAVVLLVPLLVVGWRDRLRWWPRLAVLAGGLAQLVVSRVHPRPVREEGASWSLADVVTGFVGQAGSAPWTDTGTLAARLTEPAGVAGLVVLLVVPAAACGVLVARGDARHRSLACALVLTAGLAWSAGLVTNVTSSLDFASWPGETWAERPLLRYATTAGMLLLALVLASLDVLGSLGRRWPAVVVVAGVLTTALVAARPDAPPRALGDPWPAQGWFEKRCAADPRPDAALVVPISPPLAVWTATVPCSAIRD